MTPVREQLGLTDDDIDRIVAGIIKKQGHVCRYGSRPEEVEEAVNFVKHMNSLMAETGSTIRKTIIVAGVGGLITLLVLGVYSKIRSGIGI